MKKRFTLSFVALLAAFATPTFASLDEFSSYAVGSIGTAVQTVGDLKIHSSSDALGTSQYYVIFNDRDYDTSYGGGYWSDTSYDSSTESGTGVINMSAGPDVIVESGAVSSYVQYLVRFVESDTEGEYYVQFADGNYVAASGWGDSYDLQSASTIYDADPFEIGLIAETDGHFYFLTENYIVDNNGATYSVTLWGTGAPTEVDGNNDWTIYPIEFVELDERESALTYCASTYSTYVSYSGTFTTGTDPGCYGEEEVAAFEAALAAAAECDGPDAESLTAEELTAMGDAIIEAYNAVLASLIPYNIEVTPGYYYIYTRPDFYYTTVTTEDTEDPETGETIEGTTTTTYAPKAMYSYNSSGTIYGGWADPQESAAFLWKIGATDEDRVYTLVNMGTDAAYTSLATSTVTTMSTETLDTGIAFDINETVNDTTYVCIRVASQAERSYYYMHQNGHSNGAGTSGTIVGWSNTTASEWTLIPVSDEEAEALIEAYAPTKDADARYNNTLALIEQAEAEMEIATDVTKSDGLITSADQLSSPYTDPTEGSLDALLDGDQSTYWHSTWQGGSVDAGVHYLQVDFDEAVEGLILASVGRRTGAYYDHITSMGVYTVDGDTETLIATLDLPFGSNTETVTATFTVSDPATTLRFYEFATSYERGYWHMGEFQLYNITENPTSQRVAISDTYDALEAAIEAAEAEGEDITLETYEALVAAYEAWSAVYVDPTELRETLETVADAAAGMVVGTNPGEWASNEAATTLQSTIDAATAYDAAGYYTQTQSDEYVADLTAQAEAILASAITIQEGKWYEFRIATEEEYETNGWSTSGVASTDYYDELFGKYAAIGILNEEDDSYSIDPVSESDIDEVCVGQEIYFQDKTMDIVYDDAAKFRFIAVGDTAYMIQNKATGLFMKAYGAGSAISLSVHPSLFNVTAIGYGQNVISAESLEGEDLYNLHAQLAYNMLVTWSSEEVGSNSGLFIEEVEDVADDYDGSDFNLSVVYGAVNTYCFPVSITANEGTMYGVEVDGTTVTLKPLEDNTAAAGQPFVFINGDTESYDSEAEAEPVSFTRVSDDLCVTAQASGKLVGVYDGETIGSGKIIASGNEFAVGKASSTSVDDNSAYINVDVDIESEITLVISSETFDSINEVVSAVSENGNIYTIDGRLVGKGNVNSLKSLGRGIYIVNGVKVLVK